MKNIEDAKKGVASMTPEQRKMAQQKSRDAREARKIRNASLPKSASSKSRAIREKCLDCSAGNKAEIRRCEVKGCPLWWHRCKNPENMGPKEASDGEE